MHGLTKRAGNTIPFGGERLACKDGKEWQKQANRSLLSCGRCAATRGIADSYQHASKRQNPSDEAQGMQGQHVSRLREADELTVCPVGRPSFILGQFERE
jgi:sulfur relay (sulfurtransferase) complex TusBCD TusD component (DsrE family)